MQDPITIRRRCLKNMTLAADHMCDCDDDDDHYDHDEDKRKKRMKYPTTIRRRCLALIHIMAVFFMKVSVRLT